MKVPLLRFGHEIRWCFAIAHVPQSHAFCDWQAGWPQDVANLRNKLKSFSFSRVSEVALDPLFRVLPAGPVRPSGPCCLGVAEAPVLSLESWKTATFLRFRKQR